MRKGDKRSLPELPTGEGREVTLRIVLISPPEGVDFGIQEGKGSKYQTLQRQRSKGNDLHFEFKLRVNNSRGDGAPNFVGQLTQGPRDVRFIYIDIGKLAGQSDSCWERRIKVPLSGLAWEMIDRALDDPNVILQARLPGTGKDGGPICATVQPIDGWTC